MIVEKYPLLNEPNRTIVVFNRGNFLYGHILKNSTEKAPVKLMFETGKYASIEALKEEFPPAEELK